MKKMNLFALLAVVFVSANIVGLSNHPVMKAMNRTLTVYTQDQGDGTNIKCKNDSGVITCARRRRMIPIRFLPVSTYQLLEQLYKNQRTDPRFQ